MVSIKYDGLTLEIENNFDLVFVRYYFVCLFVCFLEQKKPSIFKSNAIKLLFSFVD